MEVQMKYKWATLGTGVIANELVQAWLWVEIFIR